MFGDGGEASIAKIWFKGLKITASCIFLHDKQVQPPPSSLFWRKYFSSTWKSAMQYAREKHNLVGPDWHGTAILALPS